MNLEQIFVDYPVQFDIFGLIIFLGTVQGAFLTFFFLSRRNREVKSNIYLGLLLFSVSLISFDILISYTNFMFSVLHLVDLTEPLNLMIGPSFYFYIKCKCDESSSKKSWLHFLPAILYAGYLTLYIFQPVEAKFNSYIEQYHPELETIQYAGYHFSDPLFLKWLINEFTMISIALYTLSSAAFLFRFQKNSIPNKSIKKHINVLWIDVLLMFIIFCTIVYVKFNYEHDLGDYIIIITTTLFIYTLSFKVIRESVYFQMPKQERKYRKSGLDEETKDKILTRVMHAMQEEKLFYNPNLSLPDLAKVVGFSPNYVSQVINERLILSFPEMLAKYRVDEARRLILDPNTNETIEGIAYRVGYNSKSTFFAAFKKINGKTPAEFKASHNII